MARTPIHPAGILADALDALCLGAAEPEHLLDVPPSRIGQILAGKRAISATPLCAADVISAPRRTSG
jgi:plasmid maintenance system antidote protein VapI